MTDSTIVDTEAEELAAPLDLLLTDANLDWRDRERLQFVLGNIVEAASPSNNSLLNPLGYKAVLGVAVRLDYVDNSLGSMRDDTKFCPRAR
ncbi:hypothetical protein [Rhodococcus oxybenzonivorans]|nr:hypothetical protein [Rhodococcus oxybenzonivorans]